MFRNGWNKVVAMSLVLASAGILACLARFFDNYVPKGSWLALLAAAIPLGLLILGLLACLAWGCDKCEGYWDHSAEKLPDMPPKKSNKASATPGNPTARDPLLQYRITIDIPPSHAVGNRYLGTLRPGNRREYRAARPRKKPPLVQRLWHGQ